MNILRLLRRNFSVEAVEGLKAHHGSDDLRELVLNPYLKENLIHTLKITKLYSTQKSMYKAVVEAKSDLILQAKTGTGKTLGYVLPSLQREINQKRLYLSNPESSDTPLSSYHALLILTLTRELCIQLSTTITSLLAPYASKMLVSLYPGQDHHSLTTQLLAGPPVVVATPQMLQFMITRKAFNIDQVRTAIFDEADALLQGGSSRLVRRIIDRLPEKSLKIYVSAAGAPSLAPEASFHDFTRTKSKVRGDVSHRVCRVSADIAERLRNLELVLTCLAKRQTIIFASSQSEARAIYESPTLEAHFGKAGILEGNMSPFRRSSVITDFRSGELNILVSGGLGGRGLDFPDVDLVIQFRPPSDPSDYLHRAGRTGRGAKSGGIALLMYDGSEESRVAKLRENLEVQFKTHHLPVKREITEHYFSRVLENVLKIPKEDYQAFLPRVKQLVNCHSATSLLSTAFALLDNRYVSLFVKEAHNRKSTSTRVVLIHDPNHQILPDSEEAEKFLKRLVPDLASEGISFNVKKTEEGYCVVLPEVYAVRVALQSRNNGQHGNPNVSVVPQETEKKTPFREENQFRTTARSAPWRLCTKIGLKKRARREAMKFKK